MGNEEEEEAQAAVLGLRRETDCFSGSRHGVVRTCLSSVNILFKSYMPVDTPLHKAAHKGDIDAVEQLLKDGMSVNELGAGNRTALHRAVGANHESLVAFLIEHGADINLADDSGRTPL